MKHQKTLGGSPPPPKILADPHKNTHTNWHVPTTLPKNTFWDFHTVFGGSGQNAISICCVELLAHASTQASDLMSKKMHAPFLFVPCL